MILRAAALDDALDVLAWRNDPLTRDMSRAQDPIDEAGHLAWFGQAIADPNRTLLIGELGGEKIGMVRFDRAEETEVSINMNPRFRGRGLGYELLMAALAQARGSIVAEIREENLASQRLFERAGFVFDRAADGLRRYVRPATSAAQP
jgi:RimJ/RimL family protein N-acetyltransferase